MNRRNVGVGCLFGLIGVAVGFAVLVTVMALALV
ncbi:hypothetical protein GGR98_000892 [Parageobacillus caldoxylosilyticus]|nr:hypothetical protein [Parageobacillus caldoxylosilyticus]